MASRRCMSRTSNISKVNSGMRMKGKDGIARAIYVTAERERVVVVHAFTKKTQKTPARALDVARIRAKEVV